MKPSTLISWIARLAVAGMFLFTGIYKLTGNADAQATFAELGGTPMMYLTGLIEITGAALVLIPKTRALGGVLALGVMGGAIVSHLANLVPDDEMLPMAIALFLAAGIITFLHRAELPLLGTKAIDKPITSQPAA